MLINNTQEEICKTIDNTTESYKSIDKITSNLNQILAEIADTQKELKELYKKEKVMSYCAWSMDSRLTEASVRLNDVLAYLESVREKVDARNLSKK